MKRRQWVERNDPIATEIRPESPLSVGNGNFVFTVDGTGLQSLYDSALDETPLCTLSNWSWHTTPALNTSGRYTLKDVWMDEYDFCGRKVRYAKTKMAGNEAVYDWLRMNPHKASLARIGLMMNGTPILPEQLSDIHQRLRLYEGVIESRFRLMGEWCTVRTACDPLSDTLAIEIASDLLTRGLTIDFRFSYGTGHISGADWQAEDRHQTVMNGCQIDREMDNLRYQIKLNAEGMMLSQPEKHHIRIQAQSNCLALAAAFSVETAAEAETCKEVVSRTRRWWSEFWEKGGMADFSGSADPRACELERRIVLSLYLLTINSSGCMPPAETGLTCNSWYGKAHLEMHFWHMAWAPLWGHRELLLRSLPWYRAHLPEARENAQRNGYKGARWPKMVADDAVDSPSNIAVLLVWQQPHLILLLELIRRAAEAEAPDEVPGLLREHWQLIRETAEFMADYAVYDPRDGFYHIEPPVIPVQERYQPEVTRDPSFEVAYWKYGLALAIQWAELAGEDVPEKWRDVWKRMAHPPIANGLYIAHANCPETFETTATDHPSMLQCLGVLPGTDIDHAAMKNTLDRVIETWDDQSLWGWDFAVMAMCADRLGMRPLAMELLMRPTAKNTYVPNGHNKQVTRKDLPLYLPGNGSLLLAAAQLTAGYDGKECASWGERWNVRCEGIHPYI